MTSEQLFQAEGTARKAVVKALCAEHRLRELTVLSDLLARFDIDLLVHSRELLERSRKRLATPSSRN